MEDRHPLLQVFGFALRDWWDDWVNLVIINLLWWLGWLTVVLGPPATFGLYHVTRELAHGRSLGVKGMLEGARHYFWKSWLWFLLNVLVVVVLVVNYFFYGGLSHPLATYLQLLFPLLAILWLIVQFYALPYMMEQKEPSLKQALRNALFTFLAAPGYTLVVVVVAVLLLVLGASIIVPLFLGLPCFVASIGNRAVRERLETFGIREVPELPTAEDENE